MCKHLQGWGIYWSEMAKDAYDMLRARVQCSGPLNIKESYSFRSKRLEAANLDFLLHRMLPDALA